MKNRKKIIEKYVDSHFQFFSSCQKRIALHRTLFLQLFLLSFFIEAGLTACTDKEVTLQVATYSPADPSLPVTATTFKPASGGMGTRLFISGSNFGTDKTLINVTVGGQKANIISSNGSEIYCLVPRLAEEGTVAVEIKNPDGTVIGTAECEDKFDYEANSVVVTLCGVVSERGEHSINDGPLAEAGWNYPTKILLDTLHGRRDLYVIEEQNSIRKIDLDAGMVSTVISKDEGFWQDPREISWSADGDTLFVADNQSNEESPGVHFAVRKNSFKPAEPYIIKNEVRTVAVNPVDGNVFYSFGHTSECFRVAWSEEEDRRVGVSVCKAPWEGWSEIGGLYFHPEGKYVYFIVNSKNQIWKADYDFETGDIGDLRLFAGKADGERGYAEGVGTKAEFAYPAQGCFVKNPEYVKAGKNDVYDFYFTDCDNHCIRKMTPEAAVTTFAGRGSWSTDESVDGYIDGDLRQTARFKNPLGIAYEESTSTFYIADKNNYRIRMIMLE